MPSSPTSPLDPRELMRLAELARLEPTFGRENAGGPDLAGGLRAILEYVGRLEPLASDEASLFPADSGAAPVLRPDEPRPSLDRDRVLAAAPERLGDFFGVARVLG